MLNSAHLPVVSYNSKVKVVWSVLQIISILSASIVFSYRITYGQYAADTFYWLIIFIFAADIYFGFSSGVKVRLHVIDDRAGIARNYMRSWFTVDLLAAIPFTSISMLLLGDHLDSGFASPVMMIDSLLPLLKLSKAGSLFKELQFNLGLNPSWMRLLVFGFWFAFAVHLMALGWIVIGAAEAGRIAIDQYIRSLYWCTTTIATIGYGDYYPDHSKNAQIIYAICVQIVGVAMFGYIIGNIASIIANLDVAKAHTNLRSR